MGAGKTIRSDHKDKTVNVRDYGRNSSWESDVVSNEYRWKYDSWLLRNQWV
jgi:hypothetical protein